MVLPLTIVPFPRSKSMYNVQKNYTHVIISIKAWVEECFHFKQQVYILVTTNQNYLHMNVLNLLTNVMILSPKHIG